MNPARLMAEAFEIPVDDVIQTFDRATGRVKYSYRTDTRIVTLLVYPDRPDEGVPLAIGRIHPDGVDEKLWDRTDLIGWLSTAFWETHTAPSTVRWIQLGKTWIAAPQDEHLLRISGQAPCIRWVAMIGKEVHGGDLDHPTLERAQQAAENAYASFLDTGAFTS